MSSEHDYVHASLIRAALIKERGLTESVGCAAAHMPCTHACETCRKLFKKIYGSSAAAETVSPLDGKALDTPPSSPPSGSNQIGGFFLDDEYDIDLKRRTRRDQQGEITPGGVMRL